MAAEPGSLPVGTRFTRKAGPAQQPKLDPERPFRRRFTAEGTAVRETLRLAVEQFAPRITADEAGTLELALAEVLNNVVEHAYANTVPGLVEVEVHHTPAALVCRVEDRGQPMPGLMLPAGIMQPVAGKVEDMAEGGWGWAMIRALTADLRYRRMGEQNRLDFSVLLDSR
jgi:serine/threonine-protein kinase RsbW